MLLPVAQPLALEEPLDESCAAGAGQAAVAGEALLQTGSFPAQKQAGNHKIAYATGRHHQRPRNVGLQTASLISFGSTSPGVKARAAPVIENDATAGSHILEEIQLTPFDPSPQSGFEHFGRGAELSAASTEDAVVDDEELDEEQNPGEREKLDEDGYQVVAKTCCNYEMEQFIRRVLIELGLELCHEGVLVDLVPNYTCEKGVQTYEHLKQEITEKMPPAECPLAAEPGKCPPANATCAGGEPDPATHRRRTCNAATSSSTSTTTTIGQTTVTKPPTSTTTKTTTTITTVTVVTTTSTVTTTEEETTTFITTTEPPTTMTTTMAVTTTTTTSTGCLAETDLLDFFNSKLAHSNLGNAGPEGGVANMRFESVGVAEGKAFDMVVESLSPYIAANVSSNGYECGLPANGCTNGRFGQISVAAGTRVDLMISFQDTVTQMPVRLNRFLFSLHDFDQAKKGTMREVAYITAFEGEPIVSNGTEVEVTLAPDGRTKLQSLKDGDSCNDPENPLLLTTKTCDGKIVDQKTRSVAFVFAQASTFALSLEVTCKGCTPGEGRTFLFTGDTNLVTCPGRR